MTNPTIDILDRLPFGIVMADGNGNPLLVNRTAQSLLALCEGRIPVPPELTSQEYRVDWSGRTIEIIASPLENNVLFTLKPDGGPCEAPGEIRRHGGSGGQYRS
jgi:hypothetical protein